MSGSSSGAVTLDQLIALSDEMSALVRAGVPLDRGLVEAGRDLRGRAGRLASRLGDRLERGEGLTEALEADGESVPPFYRAVIEAGLQSGRLTKALEGLAIYARNIAETRRAIGLALLYPMLVLLLANGLLVVFSFWIAPRLLDSFETFRIEVPRVLGVVVWLGDHLIFWAPVVPAVLAMLAIAWVVSGRASSLHPGRLAGFLRLIPGMRSLLVLAQTADFADLLALMVEHDVPLDRAIGLAAEATGSPRLRASAEAVSERLRRGDPDGEAVTRPGGLPPMLSWVIATAGARGPLAQALRHASATYRSRAARKAEALQALLPSILLCLVGAAAGIVYIVAVFAPVVALWRDLALPMAD